MKRQAKMTRAQITTSYQRIFYQITIHMDHGIVKAQNISLESHPNDFPPTCIDPYKNIVMQVFWALHLFLLSHRINVLLTIFERFE
mgnify:CR=1 FL=1